MSLMHEARTLIRDRAFDVALSALGVTTALGSAAFAGYMVVIGPGHGVRPAAVLIAALPPPARPTRDAPAPQPSGAGASGSIDFEPTGSIPGVGEAVGDKDPGPDPDAVLGDFAVRDVFDGTALVEAHGTLRMVTPGSVIDGAGKVLAVERTGGVWTVRTAGGTIRQRR